MGVFIKRVFGCGRIVGLFSDVDVVEVMVVEWIDVIVGDFFVYWYED